MFSVVMTIQAEEDIAKIGDYIAYTLSVPETAYHFVQGLRASVATLQNMPERYALMNDEVLASQGIRCMPYKNHYIFYQVFTASHSVVVLRVGYNRKNWELILKGDSLSWRGSS